MVAAQRPVFCRKSTPRIVSDASRCEDAVPTSESGRGCRLRRSPGLMGFQVTPPSSGKRRLPPMIAMKIRGDRFGSIMMCADHMTPGSGLPNVAERDAQPWHSCHVFPASGRVEQRASSRRDSFIRIVSDAPICHTRWKFPRWGLPSYQL